MSVVGYDNTFFARLSHISLTTVDQPREEMGRLAVQLLAARVEGSAGEPELVLTTPTFILRRTTAPVTGAP